MIRLSDVSNSIRSGVGLRVDRSPGSRSIQDTDICIELTIERHHRLSSNTENDSGRIQLLGYGVSSTASTPDIITILL
jgi:hypothetical protein